MPCNYQGEIWIDLENTPHVMLFGPLISEFNANNYNILFTARDCAQTIGVLKSKGYVYHVIGKQYYGANVTKSLRIMQRAYFLWRFMRRRKLKGFVSHGSRSGIIAAKVIGLPIVTLGDYEYSNTVIDNALSKAIMRPNVTNICVLKKQHLNMKKYYPYDGVKEDIYLSTFLPDLSFKKMLCIPEESTYIVFRSPATSAHYHDSKSIDLMKEVINYVLTKSSAILVAVPRTRVDKEIILSASENCSDRLLILEEAVDGLNLIWNSDVVISGGGTMNREAAILGVPVYSIFTGRKGSVDLYLETEGRIKFVTTKDDVNSIIICKRYIPEEYIPRKPNLRKQLVRNIVDILEN